jgi:hypothetical protein
MIFVAVFKKGLISSALLLVELEHRTGCVGPIAPFAPNNAQVLGHVSAERNRAPQNLVAKAASRVAHVSLKVVGAVIARAVRLVAHAANETPATLVNLKITRLPGVRRGRLGD